MGHAVSKRPSGRRFLVIILIFFYGQSTARAQQTELFQNGISIIPYPKEVKLKGGDFMMKDGLAIVLDKTATENDRFAANELKDYISRQYGLPCSIDGQMKGRVIRLSRQGADKKWGSEAYSLTADEGGVTIKASGEAGLFYGVQTLEQLIQKKQETVSVKGMQIVDWPDTKSRAAHYDTKHHQDTREFVEAFIRDLARYKVNMLVWEWEDKFEYPSHPEIGAPGAFTMKEMQDLTRYAHQYHVQIVPLVQGLGHVGFILKWPQFAGLREVPASNFEFCPLKPGTYQLLSDLWHDAIKATPGSEYIHIGSDETYELGKCPDCRKKEEEIGKSGLYHLFIDKSADQIQNTGRKIMVWEAPMGWTKGRLQVYSNDSVGEKSVLPRKGLVLTESYDYETPDLKFAKQARSMGYEAFAYVPNPGIEQMFLPYFFSKGDRGDTLKGSLENSYDFLKATMGKAVFDGVIRTSWDDAGLPMQAWMLCFANAAAFSWNASAPSLPEFTSTFFSNRYGRHAAGIDSLYRLLNEGAYFYMESFERKVWAWGEIGKTHLPDLPRGDALEYDPYWNTQYADRVRSAREFMAKMDKAVAICRQNLHQKVDNAYDIEVFMTEASLIRHTAATYLVLSRLEELIKQAHEARFTDLSESYQYLAQAEQLIKDNIAERDRVFNDLVSVWDRTRLPKGMSTATKKYFFEQERTRHFANRVPDMTYLIYDEQKLGLEDYLSKLQQYEAFFRQRFLKDKVSH